MFTSGNTSPCHHSLHLFVKTDESQQAGIVQKLSDQALRKNTYSMELIYEHITIQ
ncbi:hypothetical protein SXCC_00032 [Gluconacetobacter sp. SXCC-1]|nr:hypothetical protein SXCC_00357 [Gluconacetobacter sp. SXCC-1]EGG79294.1 hypothetical protein SXCC_00032 [Gluconacetobacter sp. SXCC-1]